MQYLKAQGHMLACEPSQGVESRDYEAAVENGCCCAVEVEWMDVMRCVMLDDVMCMIGLAEARIQDPIHYIYTLHSLKRCPGIL